MTFKLGLTGSIGMGKSTTAEMFVDEGCALWDADEAVHRLYGSGGAAVAMIETLFPEAVQDDTVDRDVLKSIIAKDKSALAQLENIVHPLVAQDRANFVKNSPADITVLDIPLLFEIGAEDTVDAIVCVTVPDEIQEKRVLARGTMTADTFAQIKAKQLPNAEKCARSDYIVYTDTLDHARAQVQNVVKTIREQLTHA